MVRNRPCLLYNFKGTILPNLWSEINLVSYNILKNYIYYLWSKLILVLNLIRAKVNLITVFRKFTFVYYYEVLIDLAFILHAPNLKRGLIVWYSHFDFSFTFLNVFAFDRSLIVLKFFLQVGPRIQRSPFYQLALKEERDGWDCL